MTDKEKIVILRSGLQVPKGFSDGEKKAVTEKLLSACKTSWQLHGYKRTSIDTLCQTVGISKGAFYGFFLSKEALFYEVLKRTQAQLYEIVETHLTENQSKYGLAEALKEIYAEYCNSSFMYDMKSADFQGFLNKLSEQQQKELNAISYTSAKFMLDKPFLSLKIDEDLAMSLLSVLLTSASQKEDMLCNPNEVFAFLIDHLIESIFY